MAKITKLHHKLHGNILSSPFQPKESTLERVGMLDPVGHDALLAGCMSACKLMVGAWLSEKAHSNGRSCGLKYDSTMNIWRSCKSKSHLQP